MFGAGASYGSKKVHPYLPPLGDKLFKKLKEEYSDSWGRLPEYLSEHFHGSFELGMEMGYEFHLDKITDLMRDMNLFFLQFVVSDDSNLYVELLRKLNSYHNIIFSTLNYDTIFELAATRLGLEIEYMPNETNKSRLLKIHGSCHFLIPGNNIIDRSNVGINLFKFDKNDN